MVHIPTTPLQQQFISKCTTNSTLWKSKLQNFYGKIAVVFSVMICSRRIPMLPSSARRFTRRTRPCGKWRTTSRTSFAKEHTPRETSRRDSYSWGFDRFYSWQHPGDFSQFDFLQTVSQFLHSLKLLFCKSETFLFDSCFANRVMNVLNLQIMQLLMVHIPTTPLQQQFISKCTTNSTLWKSKL